MTVRAAGLEVDPLVLERWRQAQTAYLAARSALVGQIERQGWRAPARAPATGHVDLVFDRPPGPLAATSVDIEDDHGRSIRYGEWPERLDGMWVLRLPTPATTTE
jgi:hypothetical protein